MTFPASLTTSITNHQLPIHPLNQTKPHPTLKPDNVSIRHFNKHIDSIVFYTSIISRHCKSGNLFEANNELTRMRHSGIDPNHITFITLLSGCAHFPLLGKSYGSMIHAYVLKLGFYNDDVKVCTAIVDMYSKCGLLEFARSCFDRILVKNSVTWNTMIDGYMRNNMVDHALQVFDQMPERDAVSWTALISGFVKKGLDEKGLECFCEMQVSGVDPDYVTVIAVLAACADLGALNLGLWIHRFVIGKELEGNVRVCNTLIDMYSRCGCVDFARQVFDRMRNRTLVSWNSMIGGFAANGYVNEALMFFKRMQREGFKPDGVSFTGALTACSHAGLVELGLEFFDDMQRVYKLSPRIEHYGCLVDLYSRAGRLQDAFNVVKNMPIKPNEVVLGSLLAACRNYGDVGLAELVMKYLSELDPLCDSNYVLLANMYAAAGSWEGAGEIRRKMKTRGLQKKPGISSIEIEKGIHEFVSGDKSHPETDSIYNLLGLLSYDLGIYGYVPDNTSVKEP